MTSSRDVRSRHTSTASAHQDEGDAADAEGLLQSIEQLLQARPAAGLASVNKRLAEITADIQALESSVAVLSVYENPPTPLHHIHVALIDLSVPADSRSVNESFGSAWAAIQPIARQLMAAPRPWEFDYSVSLDNQYHPLRCEQRITEIQESLRSVPAPHVLGIKPDGLAPFDEIALDLRKLFPVDNEVESTSLLIASAYLTILNIQSRSSFVGHGFGIYSKVIYCGPIRASGQGGDFSGLSEWMSAISCDPLSFDSGRASWGCLRYGEAFVPIQIIMHYRIIVMYGDIGDHRSLILKAIVDTANGVWSGHLWTAVHRSLVPPTMISSMVFLSTLSKHPTAPNRIVDPASLFDKDFMSLVDMSGGPAPRIAKQSLKVRLCLFLLDEMDETLKVWRRVRAGEILLNESTTLSRIRTVPLI